MQFIKDVFKAIITPYPYTYNQYNQSYSNDDYYYPYATREIPMYERKSAYDYNTHGSYPSLPQKGKKIDETKYKNEQKLEKLEEKNENKKSQLLSNKITEVYYLVLHKSEEKYYNTYKELLKQFEEMNDVQKATVFMLTDLGIAPNDVVEKCPKNINQRYFKYDDLIALWIDLIKHKFNPLHTVLIKDGRNGYERCKPIHLMFEYDVMGRIPHDFTYSFGDLIDAIFDKYSKEAYYNITDFNVKEPYICYLARPLKINCLRAYIKYVKKLNKRKQLDYVNTIVNGDRNILHHLIMTTIPDTYWIDIFIDLVNMGCNVNHEYLNWNVVSRCCIMELHINVLKFLLEKGFRPSEKYFSEEQLTPPIYILYKLIIQRQSKKITNGIIQRKIGKIIEVLELYDKYKLINYQHTTTKGCTIFDFANQLNNTELLDYLNPKKPIN